MNNQTCEACQGKGWFFVDTGNDQESRYEIQRCDACEMFDSDLFALNAVEQAAEAQPALLKFVESIAQLTHENEPGQNGQAYQPASEDAIATLNRLIVEARQLLGRAAIQRTTKGL